MKKSIFKYPLETTGLQSIALPIGSEILTIQTQNEVPCIWALVPVTNESQFDAEREQVNFVIFGTGHTIQNDITKEDYIGTYQLTGGALVFHVFKLK